MDNENSESPTHGNGKFPLHSQWKYNNFQTTRKREKETGVVVGEGKSLCTRVETVDAGRKDTTINKEEIKSGRVED